MDCRTERRLIAAYADGELGLASRWLVRRHLVSCERCFADYERLDGVGHLVRSLPGPRPPRLLRTKILLRTTGAHAPSVWPRWKVAFQNILRPLAVPATGGVMSALLLFAALIPNLWFSPRQWTEDVPLTYFAHAWISNPTVRVPSPLAVNGDITVEAFIDKQGRVYDFRLIDLPPSEHQNIRAQLANTLLTTRFDPARSFGRPVRGRILISYVQFDIQG